MVKQFSVDVMVLKGKDQVYVTEMYQYTHRAHQK